MTLPVEDQLAIQQLMAEYNYTTDSGAAEQWADLFVEGGSLDTGMGFVVSGERAKFIEFAKSVAKLAPGSRHLISNVSIQGQGSEASARVYLQMWTTSATPGQTKLAFSGVYEDVLRKVGGKWKFATRVVRPDKGQPIELGPR